VKLSEIFRQAAASQIIVNAHRINQGIMPDLRKPARRKIPFCSEIAELFRTWWDHHSSAPVKASQLAAPLKEIADPHDKGRQFLARFLAELAGTHAAGFVLTRQEPPGRWGAATSALVKAPPAGAGQA
jgi:hypothetical protein